MSEYIMNRESLKRHCEKMCHKFKDVPTSGTYGEHRLVLELLEQTTWIPVGERLPEEYADVICCTDAKEVFIASYLGKLDDGTDCFDDDDGMMYEGDVIAWMPLPESYKTESEE